MAVNHQNQENNQAQASSGIDRAQKASYSGVSPAVIKRLPRYFRYLRELLRNDILRISSGELSAMMNVTASQIRQDLNCFGGFGQQGYGYNVKYLLSKISDILGVSANFRAIIVGAGNLGQALIGSTMFDHRNIDLIGLFDVSEARIGKTVGHCVVQSVEELPAFAKEHDIDIAILTVPREAARDAAKNIATLGIRGIWNFTSVELSDPELAAHGVLVENAHMGDSLMQLMYKLNVYEGDDRD